MARELCLHCKDSIDFNVLDGIDTVLVEKQFNFGGNIVRPDIALCQDGRLKAVVEVIVTHGIEDKTLEAYKTNGIVVLEVRIDTNTDISINKIPYLLRQKSAITPGRICPSCVEKNEAIEKEKEIRRKKDAFKNRNKQDYDDSKPRIKGLLAQARGKGYPILPKDSWKFFELTEPRLKRKNLYMMLLEVKQQAGMYFLDYGGKRFFYRSV